MKKASNMGTRIRLFTLVRFAPRNSVRSILRT